MFDHDESALIVRDLGRIPYEPAYAIQCEAHEQVLSWRSEPDRRPVGMLLLLEHDPPVITVSRRPDARTHLIAPPEALTRAGIQVCETDRGGDITYHGPGQVVAYPILDLNRLRWSLHQHVRTLEDIVMRVCDRFAIQTHRDHCATGVWTGPPPHPPGGASEPAGACAAVSNAKLCAIGVRVRRWITLHGLALNVSTNLDHFGLIVPCGLAGRAVTSLHRELEANAPDVNAVKQALAREFLSTIESAGAPAIGVERRG